MIFRMHPCPPAPVAGPTLAVVRTVAQGLIVSDKQRDFKVQSVEFQRCPDCHRKHPVEMPGYVDVLVVLDNGRYCEPPIERAIPLCQFAAATEPQQKALVS